MRKFRGRVGGERFDGLRSFPPNTDTGISHLGMALPVLKLTFSVSLPFYHQGPTPEPPPPKPCREHLDVGVIVDSSNSISPGDYNIARDYLVRLAQRLEVSEAGTHMAILLYSWEAHLWHRSVHSCHTQRTSKFRDEADLSNFVFVREGKRGRGVRWKAAA